MKLQRINNIGPTLIYKLTYKVLTQWNRFVLNVVPSILKEMLPTNDCLYCIIDILYTVTLYNVDFPYRNGKWFKIGSNT